MSEKVILNLGCGKTVIKNAINVDFYQTDYCDKVVDLCRFPWPWRSSSVDEIYMLYFIEHFDSENIVKIFEEAHRILKTGGLLHIQCPHFSSMIALTDIDHKKSFSATTFRVLEGHNFIFPMPLFSTELVKINILLAVPLENNYVDFDFAKMAPNPGAHLALRKVLWPFKVVFQRLVDLSPTSFERFWCYLVGGADEILYRGRKV